MIKETSKEYLTKIDSLIEQINDLKKKLFVEFTDNLKEVMEKHKVTSVRVNVNNHEFADGDPTSFSLYYEDDALNFTIEDEETGEEVEFEGYDDKYDEYGNITEKYKTLKSVIKELSDVFTFFDKDSLYEDNLGDSYDSIRFYIENGKLKYRS